MIDLKTGRLWRSDACEVQRSVSFSPDFPDTKFWPDESNVGAVFKRLAEGSNPKALFVTGDLERSIL